MIFSTVISMGYSVEFKQWMNSSDFNDLCGIVQVMDELFKSLIFSSFCREEKNCFRSIV